jgi:hypothetical protein
MSRGNGKNGRGGGKGDGAMQQRGGLRGDGDGRIQVALSGGAGPEVLALSTEGDGVKGFNGNGGERPFPNGGWKGHFLAIWLGRRLCGSQRRKGGRGYGGNGNGNG